MREGASFWSQTRSRIDSTYPNRINRFYDESNIVI